MKIIDFEKKGNVVRFYLGKDDLTEWWGDDWDDVPYEHNAGLVYSEYIETVKDIAFQFDSLVLEPREDWDNGGNSRWSKQDMIQRLVPCIIVISGERVGDDGKYFGRYVCMDGIQKYYFGDKIEVY